MPTDPAPETISFPDVKGPSIEQNAATFRAERAPLTAASAWQDYLNKVLRPVEGDTTR